MTNEIDSAAVKSCWKKIKESNGSDFFVETFYKDMFKNHPETISLFTGNHDTLHIKIIATLDNVINGIQHIENIRQALLELGQKHKELNIKPEMFDYFLESIVTSANISSDYTLSEDEKSAWKAAFKQISKIMLESF